MKKFRIDVQRALPFSLIPKNSELKRWAVAALEKKIKAAELTIRIVDIAEMTELNTRYRHKKGPTNVLSFPFDLPPECDEAIPLLGDIVICADVVNREAEEQKKTREAHWAHIVVHGVLHLLGYDHEVERDALIMESEEVDILNGLGFLDPYKLDTQI